MGAVMGHLYEFKNLKVMVLVTLLTVKGFTL